MSSELAIPRTLSGLTEGIAGREYARQDEGVDNGGENGDSERNHGDHVRGPRTSGCGAADSSDEGGVVVWHCKATLESNSMHRWRADFT